MHFTEAPRRSMMHLSSESPDASSPRTLHQIVAIFVAAPDGIAALTAHSTTLLASRGVMHRPLFQGRPRVGEASKYLPFSTG